MVDIQCAAAEIRRGKKIEDRKKSHDENIMACLLHRVAIINYGHFGGILVWTVLGLASVSF